LSDTRVSIVFARAATLARLPGMDGQALTIVHVDAERGFSGGEVQVFLLMEGLRARGHRSILCAPPKSRAIERAHALGFETWPLSMGSDLALASVLRLRKRLRRECPSLAHLHTGRATWLGGLAARGSGVPAITTRRMDRAVKQNARNRLIYGKLVRRAVAISSPVRACLIEGGVAPERVALIHSSIDPRAVVPKRARESVRAELGERPDDVVVLTLAALVERKGIDVLVDALATLPAHVRAWIAGDGSERASLERRAVERGVAERVRFLGRREDAADLLGACDVFVLPARREGLGVSALEALAAGRAVVASKVGGLAEVVVDGECGLCVPPGDVAALARALEMLVEDRALCERLAAAGPARVASGFLAEQMVASYEKLYREVLSEPRT
jgi:glycosyltransferase involved in cell wall biosynthesis